MTTSIPRIAVRLSNAAAVLALVGLTACASARPSGLCAALRGAGPGSDAQDMEAHGSARIDLEGTTARFQVRVTGAGEITATHIHKGRAGENGPMAKEINPGFRGDSVTGEKELPPDLVADLARDPSAFYVKLHSLKYPGGAVRGQLEPCQTPGGRNAGISGD